MRHCVFTPNLCDFFSAAWARFIVFDVHRPESRARYVTTAVGGRGWGYWRSRNLVWTWRMNERLDRSRAITHTRSRNCFDFKGTFLSLLYAQPHIPFNSVIAVNFILLISNALFCTSLKGKVTWIVVQCLWFPPLLGLNFIIRFSYGK
jgi:hypothetical protein